jgi:hypothetical protein
MAMAAQSATALIPQRMINLISASFVFSDFRSLTDFRSLKSRSDLNFLNFLIMVVILPALAG